MADGDINKSINFDNEVIPILKETTYPGGIKELLRYPRSPVKCMVCSSLVYIRKDPKRGEWICQECGYVHKKIVKNIYGREIQQSPEQYIGPPPQILIDPEEYAYLTQDEKYRRIWRLQDRYEHKTHNMTEYRHESLYRNFIGVVATEYKMTKSQQAYVIDVLNFLKTNGGLQRLGTRLKWEILILALCIYSMRSDHREVQVKTDQFCQDMGLGLHEYQRIMENLVGIQGDYYRHYHELPGLKSKLEA